MTGGLRDQSGGNTRLLPGSQGCPPSTMQMTLNGNGKRAVGGVSGVEEEGRQAHN